MGHDHCSINAARPWSLILPILFCLLVLGCTSTPKLKPALPLAAEQEKIQKTIAVVYSSEFREYKHVADPYRNKHNVEFLIGAASVELFRSVFSRTFREVKELETLAYGEEELQGVDVIIEPKIKSFKFYSRMAGHQTYWADVTYEVALKQPDGGQASTWHIRGTGENSGDTLLVKSGPGQTRSSPPCRMPQRSWQILFRKLPKRCAGCVESPQKELPHPWIARGCGPYKINPQSLQGSVTKGSSQPKQGSTLKPILRLKKRSPK